VVERVAAHAVILNAVAAMPARVPMKILLALSIVVLLAGCAGTTIAPPADPGTQATSAGSMPTATGGTSATAGGGAGDASGTPLKVALKDNTFEDGDLMLDVGRMVSYVNEGQHGHTVTIHYAGDATHNGDPGTTLKLDQVLAPGEAANYKFEAPGTYHVWCKYHGTMTSGMSSVVTVQ
jgi:plastocyanin